MPSPMSIIEECLVEGLGVEDAAVLMGIPVQTARDCVAWMRATGRMKAVIEARRFRFSADRTRAAERCAE